MITPELSDLLQTITKASESAKEVRSLLMPMELLYAQIAGAAIDVMSREISETLVKETLKKTERLLGEAMPSILSQKPAKILISLDRWISDFAYVNHRLQVATFAKSDREIFGPN